MVVPASMPEPAPSMPASWPIRTSLAQRPIPGEEFELWLEVLLALQGPDLLRVKAILSIDGHDKPVALHGVQHFSIRQ